ncbi:MAG: septum formation protein Maf [Desulfobulbaceae bacterium]|nr:septum formation protein Maf [Desulfobulbaceae bacterium]
MPSPLFYNLSPIILASASPRRHRLLSQLDLVFDVIAADIDETPITGEEPEKFALRMARGKAVTVSERHPDSIVIGADTVVTVDQTILGKPRDSREALNMLKTLNHRTHRVITGLSLYGKERNLDVTVTKTTSVTFGDFPEEVLRAYIRTGEPMDKAGSYGIKGKGGFLVQGINGSCSNVIGLPVGELTALLLDHHIIAPTRKLD